MTTPPERRNPAGGPGFEGQQGHATGIARQEYHDATPARATDPHTSHLAAAEIIASGARAEQQRQVLTAVRAMPGSTSAELAQTFDLDRYAVARRLPELDRAGFIRRGDARRCDANGRTALTWWPA